MWIVAIAWIYIVVLMAATEPTVVGGIMTFLFYCALPLSLLFYISGARRRRRARMRAAASHPGYTRSHNRRERGGDTTGDDAGDGGGDGGD